VSDDGQQGANLVEAQAHGQGRDRELLFLGQGEVDGLEQPIRELGVLTAEDVVALDQFLSGRSAAMLSLDGGQDLLGVAEDALTATAGLLGLVGDGAVSTHEARHGIGDSTNKGYGANGDGSSVVCVGERSAELGSPPPECVDTDPRRLVFESLRYLKNNADKMQYDLYRCQELPIMTSAVESVIKMINRRVKGSEKFWSGTGAEAILQLRADYLSETETMSRFWLAREAQAAGAGV
jgi:hypothetical protein